jgi:endoglucanase
MQDQVDRVTGAGAFIILELHNGGRRKRNGKDYIIGEDPAVTIADFTDGWTRMALQWKDNPRVIFELMNEPHEQDIGTLVEVSNAGIAAIRATGATNLIMVCGINWNSLAWGVGSDNQSYMLKITDPLDHFCFDVHHYFDEWGQGKGPNVRDDPVTPMRNFLDWARANRRRGFCGEFGCSFNKAGLDACRELLVMIEGNPDVFMGWAFLGAGGPWLPDYVYLLDPFASITAANNPDPEGSITWANPVDRPQMKLLQRYLPGATPFNAWLIEDELASSIKALYRHGDLSASGDRWLDSGPKGRHATAGWGSRPKPEGDGGVTFAASGQYLAGNFESTGEESIYAVVKLPAKASDDLRTILGSDSAGGRQFAVTTKGALAVIRSGEAPPAASGPEAFTADTALLVQARLSSPGQNRASRSLELATTTGMASDIAPVQRFASGMAIIGAADEDGTQGLDGTLHDLAVFDRPLSDEDNARVQGRLHWDKGLAHLLPDDHPYRRRPPATG